MAAVTIPLHCCV